MKKFIIAIMILVGFAAEWVIAASAITPAEFSYIKTLKRSIEYPIDLFQSSKVAAGGDHGGHFFTLRTLANLSPVGLTDYEKRQIRNEICASTLMLQTNDAIPSVHTPGSLGVYEYKNRIVALADNGLAGEPLDSVLRKLSTANDAVKRAAAKYYAVAMTKNLELIHAANIIWNDVNLRNFYVRPDGHLAAIDFGQATHAQRGNLPEATLKSNEWKNFVVNTLPAMYKTLFPGEQGTTEFVNFITTAGQGGAVVTANDWRTHAWNLATFVNVLNRALGPNGVNAASNVAGVNGLGISGLGAVGNDIAAGADGDYSNGDGRALAYLNLAENVPYKPAPPAELPTLNILKGELMGTAYQGVDGGNATAGRHNLLPAVMGMFIDPATNAPYADHAAFCTTWNGQ